MSNITKAEKAQVKKALALLREEFDFSHRQCRTFSKEDKERLNFHEGRKEGIRLAFTQFRQLLGNEYYRL